MKALHTIALIFTMLMVACSTGKKQLQRQANAPKNMVERLDQKHSYVKDKDGNWVPNTNKRSSFENVGDSPHFGKSLGNKQFDPTTYSKKPWTGRSDYNSKAYTTQTNSNITKRDAGLNDRTALTTRDKTLQQDNYRTGTIDTIGARENSARRLDKPSDAETDFRRRVYVDPEVIDHSELRDISIEESRQMLRR